MHVLFMCFFAIMCKICSDSTFVVNPLLLTRPYASHWGIPICGLLLVRYTGLILFIGILFTLSNFEYFLTLQVRVGVKTAARCGRLDRAGKRLC